MFFIPSRLNGCDISNLASTPRVAQSASICIQCRESILRLLSKPTQGKNAQMCISNGKGARGLPVRHPLLLLSFRESKSYRTSRYFQPLDISPKARDTTDQTRKPKSSSDPVLTAFVQLGALRFQAKRGLITLSSRDTEYIVAESGVQLGLQQDDDSKDPLWHGTG